jgi:peptide deformylase
MEPVELEGTEFLARAMMHEIDHLDGHMYVDKVEGKLMSMEDFERLNDGDAEENADSEG